VDALDEVQLCHRKALLSILSSKLQDLPEWVRVVVTSRPEPDIVHSFACLKPTEIMEDDPRHLEDIRLFVEHKLGSVMDPRELTSGVELFVSRSQGRFIYVSSMMDEISKDGSRWTLADLNDRLPEGLVGWYRDFFMRMKARDPRYFEEVIFRVVRVLVCSRGPMSLEDVKTILHLQLSRVQEQRLIDQLHQLFPLRRGDNSDPAHSRVFVPFHKSVFDWLTEEESSGSYLHGEQRDDFFISLEEGNQIFVNHFRPLFVSKWLDDGDLSHRPVSRSYFYRHAFDHFLSSRSPEDVSFGSDQLFRLRVLASLLEERGIREVIGIVKKAPASSELSLLSQLLQLSAPAFERRHALPFCFPLLLDIDALPFQILARLSHGTTNLQLNILRQDCESWRSVGRKGFWLKPLRNYLTPPEGPLERTFILQQVCS
jgi:hypothetical protein